MLFKKIRLKNIRSYIDEEIIFPEGIVLLSGDIGSGKSTILLSIDFALFGIRRGELSGSALLRNGSNEGFVILDFLIDNKQISIKRTIKKASTGIMQDSGYLTINDITEQLTPVELKQRILQLLNYPQDMLNKKSLMYRYTVYTPQEEMKIILLGEKEGRLETLRKVFNIDKYKRVKDNAKILTSEIKERKKECIGVIQDLDEKRTKFELLEKNLTKLNEEIKTGNLRLQTISDLLNNKKQEQKHFENEVEKFNQLKKEIEITQNKYNSKEENKMRNLSQIKIIERQILEEKISESGLDLETLKKEMKDNEDLLKNLEVELKDVFSKRIETKSKKNNVEEIKSNINKLDFCPLCKQKVGQEHKHAVISREEESLIKINSNLEIFMKKEQELNDKIKNTKELIQNYKLKEKEREINSIKIKEVNLKKELLLILNKELNETEVILKELLIKKQSLDQEITQLKDVGDKSNKIKQELEELLQQQKMLEINRASSNKELESVNKEILNINKEIKKKEQAKEKLNYYITIQDWTETFFTNMIELIERKVMVNINSEFNILFQKWFSMLVNTDLIKIRLDEEFTPVIEQNSHDIEYENLSGGEKTACALAYRLALNQVINTIVSSIKTKDLIILDEPTDGFSSEQLDKIRDVLNELKMNQIIIVSHESKIESFVDKIIKLKKDGHISNVVT